MAKNAGVGFISVRTTEEVRAALEKVAIAQDRSMNWIAQWILKEYLVKEGLLKAPSAKRAA